MGRVCEGALVRSQIKWGIAVDSEPRLDDEMRCVPNPLSKVTLMKLTEFLLPGIVAAAMFTGAAAAQIPTAENVWSHTDGGLNWMPEHVSIGNYGTAVFSHTSLDNTRALLLSRHDTSPPTPIWELVTNPDQGVASASAARANCHIAMTRAATAIPGKDTYRLKKYSAQGHDWTYEFPYTTDGRCVADISSDGRTIITVLANPLTGWNQLTVFSPQSNVPVSKFQLASGTLWTSALSGDGSILALGIGADAYVVDVASGAALFRFHNGAEYADMGMALSMDGRVFVTARDSAAKAVVYEWDGATYKEVYTQSWPGAGKAHAVAISEDAETVAFAFAGASNPSHEVGLFIVDLPTKTLLASDVISGTNRLIDYRPKGVDVSAGGRVIALAMSGDPRTEKVRFYRRESGIPVAGFTAQGQPFGVDLEPWGMWAAVGFDSAIKAPCNVCLFRIGIPDLALRGRPCIGTTPMLEVTGQPGQLAWAIVSPGVRKVPAPIPMVGTLIVQLFGSYMLSAQLVPPEGIASLPFAIQMDPALIGTTLWVQGVTLQPMELTHQAFPILMMP